MCPDGQAFKAGVFEAWTAFQLSWKIAHVRGMKEKLGLVIQEVITDLHLGMPSFESIIFINHTASLGQFM